LKQTRQLGFLAKRKKYGEKIMKNLLKNLSIPLIGFSLFSCGMSSESNSSSKFGESRGPGNIVEVANASGNFKTLLAAAKAAGLDSTLATKENLTVFAPTDAAFAKLPSGTLDALLKDIPALRNILTYHVVDGKVPASVAVTLREATMLNGAKVSVRYDGKDLFINDSKVITADIQAKNGIIHVIDTVLIPTASKTALGNIVEVATAAGSFKTLLAAAGAAGLADTLATTENITVFAPTDEAFAKLPAGTVEALLNDLPALRNILTYHVVGARVPSSDAVTLTEATMLNGLKVKVRFDGRDLFINDSKVITKDIMAKNGIIHVIDAVLLPASSTPELGNIVEVAQAAGNFKTLLAAAKAAGLADTLATTQNITVFAPTDAAFSKLPAGTVEALLKNIPALRNILTYHVVGAKVPASVAVTLTEATMLNGAKVKIRLEGKDLYINNAKVIVTDIQAKNGIIHVIDAVLIPAK
jgi:transforming growth factor-beta-induced protein